MTTRIILPICLIVLTTACSSQECKTIQFNDIDDEEAWSQMEEFLSTQIENGADISIKTEVKIKSTATECGDEYDTGRHNCDANAIRKETGGSWRCECNSGFTGDGVNCTDINECAENTDDCSDNATCINGIGFFACSCKPGYSGNRTTCTNINECDSGRHNCDMNAFCKDTAGGWRCECNTGFTGDGVNCTDLDECAENTDDCSVNATCINATGSFTCSCKPGYSGNGTTCTNVDECDAGRDNCDANAICKDTAGSWRCECNTGFIGDGVNCTAVVRTTESPTRGWDKSGNRSYKCFNDSMTYNEASSVCGGYGGRLAAEVLRNPVAVSDISSNCVGRLNWRLRRPWIGLDDIGEEGEWIWSDGGVINSATTRWNHGEPNNFGGNEDCAQIWNVDQDKILTINDESCDSAELFICEV